MGFSSSFDPAKSSRPPRQRLRVSRLIGVAVAVFVVLAVFTSHEPARHQVYRTHLLRPNPLSEQEHVAEDAAITQLHELPISDPPNLGANAVDAKSASSSNSYVPDVISATKAPTGSIAVYPISSGSHSHPLKRPDQVSQLAFAASPTLDPNIRTGSPVPSDTPVDHSNPRSRIGSALQKLLDWDPPTWASLHNPPYNRFKQRDYDPNRWEAFDMNTEFFTDNALDANRESVAYKPYPEYNGRDWRAKFKGDYVSCEGVAGELFNESDRELPRAYKRKKVNEHTEPFVGSFEAVGLDGSVCFDRYSRLGPFGQSGAVSLVGEPDLGQVQNQCLERNSDRYADARAPDVRPGVQATHAIGSHSRSALEHDTEGPSHANRTAVLIRAWEDYDYEENDIVSIRSLVSELALQSGGEYHVFLFVMLMEGADIKDEALYDKKMAAIPKELRSMTIFWSEKLSEELYPNVGHYQVVKSQFMPVQWFMSTHPEFEYVWNHELDARYIGHHYHFIEKVVDFARKQPRKYLWERNARYYIPSAHGSYEEFFNNSNQQIKNSPYVKPIWGSQYIPSAEAEGPQPPGPLEADNFEWGVGEEADFISLLPMWDPHRTVWYWKPIIWGYPNLPEEIPIRAYINTHGRYSRRLLHAMHQENLKGKHMFSELFPSTMALHHSLKAVYVPHPIWTTHKWSGMYADAVFNADGWGAGSFYNKSEPADDAPNMELNHPSWGRGVAYNESRARLGLPQTGTGPNGEGAMARWGQERDSVYNFDREHNFLGWSWYYASDFGRMIYWRWLGWRQSFSIYTMGWTPEYDPFKEIGTAQWELQHGRLCLPPMLLHPVKRVHEPEQGPDGTWIDKGGCTKSGC